MATKYYQNKKAHEIVLPTYEGTSVTIKPYQFVIDGLGTYYSTSMGLTEVQSSDVVASRVAYAYMPDEPTGIVIGSPLTIPGEYATGSAVLGNFESEDYLFTVTANATGPEWNFDVSIVNNPDGATEVVDAYVDVDIPNQTVTIYKGSTEAEPGLFVPALTPRQLNLLLDATTEFTAAFTHTITPSATPAMNISDSPSITMTGGASDLTSFVPAPASGSGFCFDPDNSLLYVYNPASPGWDVVGSGDITPGGTPGQLQFNNNGDLGGVQGSEISATRQLYSVIGAGTGEARVELQSAGAGEHGNVVIAANSDVVDAGRQTRLVLTSEDVDSSTAQVRLVCEAEDTDASGSTTLSMSPKGVDLGGSGNSGEAAYLMLEYFEGTAAYAYLEAYDPDGAHGSISVSGRGATSEAKLEASDGVDTASITAEPTAVTIAGDKTAITTTVINISTLPTYADDAAAVAGGLPNGNLYKTATGALMVVYGNPV